MFIYLLLSLLSFFLLFSFDFSSLHFFIYTSSPISLSSVFAFLIFPKTKPKFLSLHLLTLSLATDGAATTSLPSMHQLAIETVANALSRAPSTCVNDRWRGGGRAGGGSVMKGEE